MESVQTLVLQYIKSKLPAGWRAKLHTCIGNVQETETSRPKPTTFHEVRMTDGERTVKVQIWKSWLGTVPETVQGTLTDEAFDIEGFLDAALAMLSDTTMATR
jgi:hypothetical protein